MLAHLNGQTVNYSALASSLDITGTTVKSYIDLLASTYMLEVIPPWFSNLGKRLVKAPKVYIADSGLTASLLGLRSYVELLGHPAAGAVWEQTVIANLRGHFPDAEFYHYRTAAGSELDLVVRRRQRTVAVECKFSMSPALGKGNYLALEDIKPAHTFVVAPVKQGWSMAHGIDTVSVPELIVALRKRL